MSENVVRAYPVKYMHIDYHDDYVVVLQNKTRARVYKGYYFDDDGIYIWISGCVASRFQHKSKHRLYSVDFETKEWKRYDETIVSLHRPDIISESKDNLIDELRK